MKKLPFILLITAGLMLAVVMFKIIQHRPLSQAGLADGQADEICYSLLKDWSEQPEMREKVRQATADNFFSEDECQDLLKYHTMIDEQAKRQRMDAYMDEAKDNVK